MQPGNLNTFNYLQFVGVPVRCNGTKSTDEGKVDRTSFSKNSFGSDVATVDAHFKGSNPAFFGAAPNIEVNSRVTLSDYAKNYQGPFSRLHQGILFDTDKSSMSSYGWSSKSYSEGNAQEARRATPEISFTKELSINQQRDSKTFEFGTHAASVNPKTPSGTPNIDVFSDFSITENKKAGTLNISGKLTGDNFPSTEAFISDSAGNNVFIGVRQIGKNVDKDFGPSTEL